MSTTDKSTDTLLWIDLGEKASELVPVALELGVLVVLMIILNRVLKRIEIDNPERRYLRLLILSLLGLFGFIVILFSLPGIGTRIGHIVTLLGVLLSAAIALSSTTFISNFMAGIMLARVSHFRAGDFLSVGEHFGRVSEMGLLHTEIQTEDSDLTTLPNLYLITNPCKAVRRTKTVVSATVSLGYDVSHTEAKELLRKAAEEVPLKDAFVQILDLGDFSVTYRVAGVLEDVKQLLSTRSKLRESMLDVLHGAKIEIVSPTFMYTRTQSKQEQVLSIAQESDRNNKHQEKTPDSVAFDKADEAESIDNLRTRREMLLEQIKTLKGQSKEANSEDIKKHIEKELQWRETSIEFLQRKIEAENNIDS